METVLRHFNQCLSHVMRTADPLIVAVHEPKGITQTGKVRKMAFDLRGHHVHRTAASCSKDLIARPGVQGFIKYRGLGSDITFGEDRGELEQPRNRTPDLLIVCLSPK